MGNKMIEGETQSKPIRKCFICEEKEALFYIKGKPEDAYCDECAEEYFGDTSYLEKLK